MLKSKFSSNKKLCESNYREKNFIIKITVNIFFIVSDTFPYEQTTKLYWFCLDYIVYRGRASISFVSNYQ